MSLFALGMGSPERNLYKKQGIHIISYYYSIEYLNIKLWNYEPCIICYRVHIGNITISFHVKSINTQNTD